ncbi:hypothetical protein UFRH6_10 [Pseudomonas phage UF_RH6]|nr:hypothetical protein UFRH6_10 [Pseudomonas phage UF_RH6]
MYLLSNGEIEALIKGVTAQAGQCCTEPSPSVFDSLHRNIRTRIEDCLGVQHLYRYTWADTFEIGSCESNNRVLLRLSNAFINEVDSVKVFNSDGSANACTTEVDQRMGLVELTLPKGRYRIQYIAGFEADEVTKVLKGTPDWMRAAAQAALRLWLLASSNSSIPKEVALGELTAAARRELAIRIYQRYDRPRGNVVWPIRDCVAVAPAAAPTENGSPVAW